MRYGGTFLRVVAAALWCSRQMFRSYGAFWGRWDGVTTAADTYGALAVAWILWPANAALSRNCLFCTLLNR